MSRILLNFIFDFPATLFITKDCSFTLMLMPTSLVFKLLYILSTSFLAYDSLVKVVQLFKRFPMIYSRTIFRKKNLTLGVQGSKSAIFVFFSKHKYTFSKIAFSNKSTCVKTCFSNFLLLTLNK